VFFHRIGGKWTFAAVTSPQSSIDGSRHSRDVTCRQPEDPQGHFTAIGVWGQYIYVEPTRDVIIIKTIADPDFDNSDYEGIVAFPAIARSVAGNGTH